MPGHALGLCFGLRSYGYAFPKQLEFGGREAPQAVFVCGGWGGGELSVTRARLMGPLRLRVSGPGCLHPGRLRQEPGDPDLFPASALGSLLSPAPFF